MKKLLVVLMCIVMTLAMAACGGSQAEEPAAGEMTVILEIDYPDESGAADVEDAQVVIPEGGSPLDAINAYAEANGIEVVMDEASVTPYIVSIGGVGATDMAGWIYEVNDESSMETAGDFVLNAGDEVSWSFESWAD